MALHPAPPLGYLTIIVRVAILVLAVATVRMIMSLLRRRLAPADERGAGEGGELAGRDSRRVQPQPLAHSWPQETRAPTAIAARAAEEPAATPAAPPERPNVSPPETSTSPSSPSPGSSRQHALQPHQSNVPTRRQPGDALLVALKQTTHRTLDERYAMRDCGKLHSPVDAGNTLVPNYRYGPGNLRAVRVETENELAGDPRRRQVHRRLNRFERPAY